MNHSLNEFAETIHLIELLFWVADISSWAMLPLLLSCDTLFGHLRCGNDNCVGDGFDSTDDCCYEGKGCLPPPKRMNFRKSSKRGGGGIFNPKIHVADFCH